METVLIWLAFFLFIPAVERGQIGVKGAPPRKGIPSEKRLVVTLLRDYNKIGIGGRPVINSSTAVEVSFGLGLITMELNERTKELTVSAWTKYRWRDEYLTWNPDDFGGIETVRLEPEKIWIPDIMLFNTGEVATEQRSVIAVINSDGMVMWFPHSIFRSTCAIKVNNYPFDEQVCQLRFGSWTHTAQQLNVTMAFPGGIDLATFDADSKEASSWIIQNVKAEMKVIPPGKEPNYAVLVINIHLQRKVGFSSYILTLPCLFLAMLTLVVFWLPPDRPDRIAIAMSSFVSFIVLLLILLETALPSASSVPILGVYYCFNMVITLLAILLSALVVNISRGNEDQGPPRWLTNITTHGIGKILCVTPKTEKVPAEQNMGKSGNPNKSPSPTHQPSDNTDETVIRLEKQVSDVQKAVRRVEKRLDEGSSKRSRKEEMVREWKTVALVLDRCFFIVYLVLTVIALAIMFPRSK